MIKARKVVKNTAFIPRPREARLLHKAANTGNAAIIVVSGRRRVGKTELIEQVYTFRSSINSIK